MTMWGDRGRRSIEREIEKKRAVGDSGPEKKRGGGGWTYRGSQRNGHKEERKIRLRV